MASKCRKFEPNIFNKLKCQACFGAKEAHSAEALENNKASRKISKCGYLFIAPDFDFNNPLDRSRRWQRRLFRLFDDGELTYCVDEDPETIPQGAIDMNKCTAVNDGEKVTSHQFSLEIVTPSKKYYVKGTSKEEYQWWFDVLQGFPGRLTKTKNRRFTMPIFSNKENVQPLPTRLPSSSSVSSADTDSLISSRFSVEKVKIKDQPFSTYRGVRNMKHNKTDKHYQEGLRKSSSLHDLTSSDVEKDVSHDLMDTRFLSRSGDRLDIVSGSKDAYSQNVARVLSDATFVNNPYFTIPRSTWQSLAANSKPASLPIASNSSVASSSGSSHAQPLAAAPVVGIPALRRSSFDDKSLPVSSKPRNARERAQLHRERSTSLKDFTTQMTLAKQDGNNRISLSGLDRLSSGSRSDSQPVGRESRQEYESRNNETDEHKMAKSSELQQATRTQSQPTIQGVIPSQPTPSSRYEDLMYMKKGWLIKQGSSEKDWMKHWFVLTGTSLRYFKDAKAEETNTLDGRIDLTGCYDISEINIGRNYGFKIKTSNGEYVLSAMTSGIRNNWMKAIRLVMDLQHGNSNKNASVDSDSGTSVGTTDDLEVIVATGSGRQSISSIDSRSGSESPRQTSRKDQSMKNIRRHYSDVSPGNVGKMLSIKDTLTNLDIEAISTPLTVGMVRQSPPEKKSEDQFDSGSVPETSSTKTLTHSEPTPEPFLSTSSMSSLSRYVEGSDNVALSGPPQLVDQRRSESKKEEEERKRRAKSPSARIREKTRSSSPRLSSPPRKMEEDIDYQLSVMPDTEVRYDEEEERRSSLQYEREATDGSQDIYADQTADIRSPSTPSSGGGDGMLVELLETEVDHLKEQLDSTQKELVKMHETNMDLKTKLQSAVREKDISQPPQQGLESPNAQISGHQTADPSSGPETSQVTTMRRQVKEARDVIQKQKAEIENLRSKLDMSVSKLTGTEKALSESLKDLKQEKDKNMKMSSDWNRRIRNLEAQLKDSNYKFERQKDLAASNESLCRRLENEGKANLQKIREHEREILKLKAVEREYKMLKEKMDEMEGKLAMLRNEVKEKDMKCKKLESDYEAQINELEQEFTRERDDVEQHMEDMKKRWLEAQKDSGMPESWSDVIQDKDDIISQLEEKLIENDKKVVDMTEELQAELNDSVNMQHKFAQVQEEKRKLEQKLDEVEKLQKKHFVAKEKLENENKVLKRQLEDAKSENKDLKCKLDSSEKLIKDLEREKHDLELCVTELHEEIDHLQKSQVRGTINEGSIQEVIHNFLIVEAEIVEVCNALFQIKKEIDDCIAGKSGESVNLSELSSQMQSIHDRCENLKDILKEGSVELSRNQKTHGNTDSNAMKIKYEKALEDATKLRKNLEETYTHCKELEMKESGFKEEIKTIENKYRKQIDEMNAKLEALASKAGHSPVPRKSRKPKKEDSSVLLSMTISEEIEEELNELEDRINHIDRVLKSQENVMNSTGINDMESSEDEEDSDDSFLSSTEDEDDEEEEDEPNKSKTSLTSSPGNNQQLLMKLNAMKSQLQVTNSKIRDITDDVTDQSASSLNESDLDGELRKTLQKCGDKIDILTSRLTEKENLIKTGVNIFDGRSVESAIAFEHCINQMKEKLVDINCSLGDHEVIEAKDLVSIQEKLNHLVEYLNQLQKFHHKDYGTLGKVTKLEARASAVLLEREQTGRRRLSQKDKIRVYADRLSVEAILLGQMAYLIQRNQIGNIHRDVMLREMQEINSVILALERRVDQGTRDLGASFDEGNSDLVSTYAAMLAEKVVLEGQLASCTMTEDNQSTDDTTLLASLNITDNPSILAMEVFMRSQVDSSVHQELSKSAADMNSVSGHVITRACIQGEITHALQMMKSRFNSNLDGEELQDLINRERRFSHERLLETLQGVSSSMDVYEALVISCLSYHICLSQNKTLLETLVAKVEERFKKQITDLRQKQSQVNDFEQSRIQHILIALEEGCLQAKTSLQTCSGDSRDESQNLEFSGVSIEALVLEMVDMLILRCIIKGSAAHVSEMFKSEKLPPLPSVKSLIEAQQADQNEASCRLGEILQNDASTKQSLAAKLKSQGTRTEVSKELQQLCETIDDIPDIYLFDTENLSMYAQNLVKEAMFQTQLTYTNYKLKLQHEKEMRDMKIKIEAGQKVDLPSESSKDAENDIQQSLSVFEEILETKFEDECEVLSILDKEMKELQTTGTAVLTGAEANQFEQQLKNCASAFEHELSVAQERHDVHLDVLRQEITNICIRMEKMNVNHEHEKEVLANDYEDKIQVLQDELDCIKEDHEEELEQVRQDILTAVSAIKANDERSDEQLSDQVKELNRQITSQKESFVAFLENVHKSLQKSGSTSSLSCKLEEQLEHLQSDGAIMPDLETFASPNSPIPVPKSPPPKETEPLLDTMNSETSNDESADRCLMDKSHHNYELQLLKQEKEQALAEEVKTTKAALDAMRKAYEEDLEVEKDRYREAIKTMFTDDFVNEIKHRHEAEVGKLSDELKQVTMHYDSKCEDYKLMEDKVENTKKEYESHINHLIKSNEQLNSLVNEEIGKLKDFIQNRTMATIPGNATIEEELYDAQIMIRVKDTELQKLRSQVKNLENNLERSTEEQRQSMTQYLQMYKKYSELNNKMKQEIVEKPEQRDSMRALRRTPSFHHRARSPSPQTSPKKDEHHSRDSHRRRHIDAKDLKRSKSSPSIPYVMEGGMQHLPSSRQQRDSIGSSKYSKVGKSKAFN